MDDVGRTFAFYNKLRQMRVPLYEGVYKMIIECCTRTHQLGHAIQFYEMLKGSGERISCRFATILMEACAKEQHGDKVYDIWKDWCPAGEPETADDIKVMLVAVSGLIRTLSPDLACDVLTNGMQRSSGRLAERLAQAEIDLEELLQLNEQVVEEAEANGTLLEGLAGRFVELHAVLESLLDSCLQQQAGSDTNEERRSIPGPQHDHELMFMEDVDLDLELAAM